MTWLRRPLSTGATIAFAALGLTGCPGFGDRTLGVAGGEVPTYEGQIKALIDTQCNGCHRDPPVAGAPFPLVTYEQAVERASRIKARSVTVREMPPGGGLGDTEAGLLKAWIEGGTPRGEAPPDAGPPDAEIIPDMAPPGDDAGGPPPPPTYADVKPIFDGSCAFPGCHGGGSPAAQLDLTSYAGFTAGGVSGDLTSSTGEPEDALLIKRVRALDGFPVMPPGGPALPEDQLSTLDGWIAAGAPEE